jgi:hypothetical protein
MSKKDNWEIEREKVFAAKLANKTRVPILSFHLKGNKVCPCLALMLSDTFQGKVQFLISAS